MATERCFLADSRGMCADKRVGGYRGKLYRCDGAVLDIKSKAKGTSSCMLAILASRMEGYRGLLMNIRYALGYQKNASPRALRAEAAKFINPNTNTTASSLKNS